MPGQVNPSILRPGDRAPKANVWDVCHTVSRKDKKTCKEVIYALLYGASVEDVMGKHALEIEDVVKIRETFDHYTIHEWKHRNG